MEADRRRELRGKHSARISTALMRAHFRSRSLPDDGAFDDANARQTLDAWLTGVRRPRPEAVPDAEPLEQRLSQLAASSTAWRLR